jgi:2-polyprenyl-3-methyl-5-hydroxy-6-metoxy-1,4-benzoquinol methylase
MIDIPREAARDRTFVTGVYGSGKTWFAKRYAARRGVPFVSFDDLFRYGVRENQSRAILRDLPAAFVMDAIPIDENAAWDDFREYEAGHDVLIVCAYCPDPVRWLRRVAAKADQAAVGRLRLGRALPRQIGTLARQRLRDLKRTLRGTHPKSLRLHDRQERAHLREYRDFYTRRLAVLRTFRNVLYYDSLRDELTSETEMLRRMHAETFPLHEHLDRATGEYDAAYQDIEALEASGYSESARTWENIGDLIEWRGRRVVDLGCFHGYFSFKIEDRGGIVTGLDRSAAALETARMVNALRGGRVEFRQWTGGDPIPECEIVLCLNVLHHFGDAAMQERVVAGMRCDAALFEINAGQLPMLERRFRELARHRSHRQNRIIVLAKGPRS